MKEKKFKNRLSKIPEHKGRKDEIELGGGKREDSEHDEKFDN